MDKLPYELINIIFEYSGSSYIDIYKFCEKYNIRNFRYMNSIFKTQLSENLRSMGIVNPDELYDILQETGSKISGSIILETILHGCENIAWYIGDIDIYTIQNKECLIRKIEGLTKDKCNIDHWHAQRIYGDGLDEYKVNKCANPSFDTDKYEYIIKDMKVRIEEVSTRSRTIGCKKNEYNDMCSISFPKVQIINLVSEGKRYGIDYFVDDSFDLDFCKNTFDGKTLNIINIDSILTKTTDLSKHKYPFTNMNRIYKYENRGFTINNKCKYIRNNLENYPTYVYYNLNMKYFRCENWKYNYHWDNLAKYFNIEDKYYDIMNRYLTKTILTHKIIIDLYDEDFNKSMPIRERIKILKSVDDLTHKSYKRWKNKYEN